MLIICSSRWHSAATNSLDWFWRLARSMGSRDGPSLYSCRSRQVWVTFFPPQMKCPSMDVVTMRQKCYWKRYIDLTIIITEKVIKQDMTGQTWSFLVIAYSNQKGCPWFTPRTQVNIAGAFLKRHCEKARKSLLVQCMFGFDNRWRTLLPWGWVVGCACPLT
jgi:hypothetical protein